MINTGLLQKKWASSPRDFSQLENKKEFECNYITKNFFYRYSEYKTYQENVPDVADYVNNYEFTPPVYIYTADVTCGVKFLSPGIKSVKLEHDQPVFMHTLYANTNLGNKWYDWEVRGKEQNSAQMNVTAAGTAQTDYYQINGNPANYEDDIPDGYYYVVIAWFADGSYQMTKPEQFWW